MKLWDENCHTKELTEAEKSLLPSGSIPADEYRGLGGTITEFGSFGKDPLLGRPDLLAERKMIVKDRFPDFEETSGTVSILKIISWTT